jgi:hypothetical protein
MVFELGPAHLKVGVDGDVARGHRCLRECAELALAPRVAVHERCQIGTDAERVMSMIRARVRAHVDVQCTMLRTPGHERAGHS